MLTFHTNFSDVLTFSTTFNRINDLKKELDFVTLDANIPNESSTSFSSAHLKCWYCSLTKLKISFFFFANSRLINDCLFNSCPFFPISSVNLWMALIKALSVHSACASSVICYRALKRLVRYLWPSLCKDLSLQHCHFILMTNWKAD